MIVVHVAAEHAWDGVNYLSRNGEPTRMVQPCARCGVVLREYDTLNPPMVAVSEDEERPMFHWFVAGDQYAFEGPDGNPYDRSRGGMLWLVSDDEVLSSDRYKLCDPSEVPEEMEVFRTIVRD